MLSGRPQKLSCLLCLEWRLCLAAQLLYSLLWGLLLYTITFTYVTFAAMRFGRHYTQAIDCDSYDIFKHFSFDFNQLKSVNFECCTYMKNEIYQAICKDPKKSDYVPYSCMPVRPSVRPQRMPRLPKDGFKITYISQLYKNCSENSYFANF